MNAQTAGQPGVRRSGADRDDGPMSQAARLLTPAGEELLGLLSGIDVTPDLALRLGAELRDRYPADLVAAALTQQALRVAAKEKFSRAGEMYFTRNGLEQASGEQVAAHSARRFAGLPLVADLCCGIGGDLTALAAATQRVLAVDTVCSNLQFATRNAAVYGAFGRVSPVCADVRDLRLAGIPAAFIDPARRAGGHRLRTGDSQPPLSWCVALADQMKRVCIKAAPGLAHALIPAGWEAEFVAVGRNLKEALLWSPAFAATPRRATVLPGGADAVGSHTLIASSAVLPPVLVRDPGEYLFDPNPAVTRAGLVAELAHDLGAWQLDPMIAFLSMDRPARTPFARTLRVVASLPWREREVAAKLRELGVGTADIRRRGLAGDVQQIHRRLGLRGDKNATIVLTRRNDRPWGLICEPVNTAVVP